MQSWMNSDGHRANILAPSHTFFELKVANVRAVAEQAHASVPLYAMTSFATEDAIRALAKEASTPQCPVEAFAQFISVRLCPDGSLFRDKNGRPSLYAPGHGDLPFALKRSGLLETFVKGGGKHLFMSNVDNVTATLDPVVLGKHIEANLPITVEVTPKAPGDKGGAPARVDGRTQVVESFRFPADFDQDRIGVFNTNTFTFRADALLADYDLTWCTVEKKVEGRTAVQFERLVGELTAFTDAQYLCVERTGPNARFQPAKDPDELARRQPEILEALHARRLLSD